jgi:hypothetical protein
VNTRRTQRRHGFPGDALGLRDGLGGVAGADLRLRLGERRNHDQDGELRGSIESGSASRSSSVETGVIATRSTRCAPSGPRHPSGTATNPRDPSVAPSGS